MGQSVDKILAWLKKNEQNHNVQFEWLWVNDGSLDNTHMELERHTLRLPNSRVLSYSVNRGKGFACRMGMLDEASTPDFIFFTDADLAIPLDHLLDSMQISRAQNDSVDVFLGNREPGQNAIHENFLRNIMSVVFRQWVLFRVSLPFSDSQCGFKGFRRETARRIFAPLRRVGFTFDVELLMRIQLMGYKAVEVPVGCDNKGLSSVRIFRDSFKMLVELERLRKERKALAKNF